MRIPRALVEEWAHEPEWLRALPGLVHDCAAQWNLELEAPSETAAALVVPAGDVVLKVNAPSHFEADHEADALEHWRGDGAVRLLARDDVRRAFLVERCRPGTPLAETAGVDGSAVVAGLLPRLQIPVGDAHPFATLADEADRWAVDVPRRYAAAGEPFERRLLDIALDVYGTVDRSARFLVNQDLHCWNILCAEREPWLVIDPKPLVGERELEASALLRNTDRVSRWLDVLAEIGFERERARAWSVAHSLAWAWDEREGWIDRHVEQVRRIVMAP